MVATATYIAAGALISSAIAVLSGLTLTNVTAVAIAVGETAGGVEQATERVSNVAKTIPQELVQNGKTALIGKMKDLNIIDLKNEEFKLADYLPNMGNPKDNWHQNSGILRSVMNVLQPIRDVSQYPMDKAGFLGLERNLLQNHGWTYSNGFWYAP